MLKGIYCPKNEDHDVCVKSHRKRMFLLDNKGIYLYCKMHGWMRFEFERAGEKIPLDNIIIKAYDIKNDKHFDIEEAPVIAIGEFKRKTKCRTSRP